MRPRKSASGAEGARVHATLGDETVVEHRSGILELLVFHEALDQHIAGLGRRELRQVVVKLVALARDEALGLDLEQRRGHPSKKSLATSRSRVSMRDTSARY